MSAPSSLPLGESSLDTEESYSLRYLGRDGTERFMVVARCRVEGQLGEALLARICSREFAREVGLGQHRPKSAHPHTSTRA